MGERPGTLPALPGAAAEELRETAGILIAHNLSDLAHGQVGICQQLLRTLHPLPLNILSDGAAVSGVKGILQLGDAHAADAGPGAPEAAGPRSGR